MYVDFSILLVISVIVHHDIPFFISDPDLDYTLLGPTAFTIVPPVLDNFAIRCTIIAILDDNFAELTEPLTLVLVGSSDSYVLSENSHTVINIEDDEGQ